MTESELRLAYLSVGKDLPTHELAKIASQCGGKVDFATFAKGVQSKMKGKTSPDEIHSALLTMDKTGDGTITTQELQFSMMQMGERMKAVEVAELLGEADKRRTGTVDARGLATLLVQGV